MIKTDLRYSMSDDRLDSDYRSENLDLENIVLWSAQEQENRSCVNMFPFCHFLVDLIPWSNFPYLCSFLLLFLQLRNIFTCKVISCLSIITCLRL